MFAAPTLIIPSSSSSPSSRVPLPAAGSRRRMVVMSSAAASTFAAAERTRTAAMSLYEILRVKRTASLTEIKTAYRGLAKMYHPDAMQESESDGRDFIEIHNAYETLSDPAARAAYDLSLNNNNNNNVYWQRGTSGAGFSGRYYPTRRWETDQCW